MNAGAPQQAGGSLDGAAIEQIVLDAVRSTNMARQPSSQLEVAPDAAIFGPGSPLDSLGLVALLLDLEEAFAAAGYPLVLSDERAVSQRRSPFRSVRSLVEYISALVQGG